MNILNNAKCKYNSLSVQLKVVFWFTLVGFLKRGISIITTPIFTRVLSKEEYGLFSVFSAWFNVLVIICTLYLHMGAINNALTKKPDEKKQIVASFQSVSFVVSASFFLFAMVFLDKISSLMKLPPIVVFFMFLGFLFYAPYNNWLIYRRYEFEYKRPVITSVIISFATPILSIIAIFLFKDNRGEARIIAFLIANTIIPGIVFYYINYRDGKVFYDKKLWKYALMFNIPLLPHFLSDTILNQSDRIMIGNIVGKGDAGTYTIAYSAASLVHIFSSALNIAFVPWQYKKLKDEQYSNLAKVSYVILTAVGGMLVLLSLFSPEVISILAGDLYLGAIKLVPILGMSVFFSYMYQLFVRVELFYEKKIYTVVATFCATILNILLNLFWIPRYGYTGASYSTLVAHIVLCLMHFVFYKKICTIHSIKQPFYRGTIILLISFAFVLCALLVIPLYDHVLIRFFILAAVIVLTFIMRKKIKNLIAKMN